jgi:hypothetical protein
MQQRILSRLARRAFAMQPPAGGGAHDGESEIDFRHRQVAVACGKAGLRACSQADYKIVEAHLEALLGNVPKVFDAHIAHDGNPRRVVEFKILESCRQARVTLAYAETICRSKYKCSLAEATDRQLWGIKFDVDRAARRKRKEHA